MGGCEGVFIIVSIEGVVNVPVSGWRGGCGGAGSGENSVGRPVCGSPNEGSSGGGGSPSSSSLTIAPRGLIGKSNARSPAVPGVATVLQFSGLVGPGSN